MRWFMKLFNMRGPSIEAWGIPVQISKLIAEPISLGDLQAYS